MDIHRIVNVSKDRDKTYRQTQYKKSGKPKSSADIVVEDLKDISDIRMASAELNRFSAMFDMKSFKEVKEKLADIISELEKDTVKIASIVKLYPSEEIVRLSELAAEEDKNK